jgi:hypothetical protein
MKLYGIEILLERMKTHPEEFEREGKWTDVLVNIDTHLTEEEREAVKQGFTNMARATFNEVVMKSIAGESVEWEQVNAIAQTYDSVLSYPLERRKRIEIAEKERREKDWELEKMRVEQQRAMQGMGGLGGQSAYGNYGKSGGGIF